MAPAFAVPVAAAAAAVRFHLALSERRRPLLIPTVAAGGGTRRCRRGHPPVATANGAPAGSPPPAATASEAEATAAAGTVAAAAGCSAPAAVRLPATDTEGEPIGWWSPAPAPPAGSRAGSPPPPPAPAFFLRKVVSPQNSDYSGALWHGAYVGYLEEARVGVLAALGVPYDALVGGEGVELVVASLAITYVSPARLGEALTVSVVAAGGGRVRVGLASEVVAAATGRLVARATVVLAPVRVADGRLVRALPPRLAEALRLFGGTWEELAAVVGGRVGGGDVAPPRGG